MGIDDMEKKKATPQPPESTEMKLEPEKIDPKALLEALGRNDMYANKKKEGGKPHAEDFENKGE